MSTHLQDAIICPHCGDRYRLVVKQNATGDVIQRGECPNTPTQMPEPLWKTDWFMVRAKVPAAALTPDEAESQDGEIADTVRHLKEASPWQA